MNEKSLKRIISKGESQEVEFKEKWPSNDTISKVICALANTVGGYMIIGINDNGEAIGLDKNLIDKMQRKISEANKAISPVPLIKIIPNQVFKKDVILVDVERAQDTSYYTYQGAIYVRVGSTNQRLEGKTQLDYLRHRQILSFDESTADAASIKDIDPDKVMLYLDARGQSDYFEMHSLEHFLITNRLAEKRNGKLNVKNAAILLFGYNPSFFHPQSEVKLVHFEGDDAVDILDYKILRTDVINTIEGIMSFLVQKLSKKVVIGEDAKRREEYEYPLAVIRESIVNAVIHRDYFSKGSIQVSMYRNRLEITSPGSLPSELSKELFGTISVQRNPIIYPFLRDLRYVEGLGTGIPRIKSEMKRAGLAEPEFLINENFIRVTLFNSNSGIAGTLSIEIQSSLNDRQIKALEHLREKEKLKAKTYSEINKVSYATAVNEINTLISLGLIEKVGAYRGVYYILPEKA